MLVDEISPVTLSPCPTLSVFLIETPPAVRIAPVSKLIASLVFETIILPVSPISPPTSKALLGAAILIPT